VRRVSRACGHGHGRISAGTSVWRSIASEGMGIAHAIRIQHAEVVSKGEAVSYDYLPYKPSAGASLSACVGVGERWGEGEGGWGETWRGRARVMGGARGEGRGARGEGGRGRGRWGKGEGEGVREREGLF
jgi:hypothetical protein